MSIFQAASQYFALRSTPFIFISLGFVSAFCVALTSNAELAAAPQPDAFLEPLQAPIPWVEIERDLSDLEPAEQLHQLAQEYQIELPSGELHIQQKHLAQKLIALTALQYGVPPEIALSLSGHESAGWYMWRKNGQTQKNTNIFQGMEHSSDWGLMQLNDAAHPELFPRAQSDMRFNIVQGIAFLAELHGSIRGNMDQGFGEWDATLAAYHLGHRAYPAEYPRAIRYLQQIRQFGQRSGSLNSYLYKVRPHQSLGAIAQQELGAFSQWEAIQALNPEVDARSLRPGQYLRLPL